MGVNYSTLSFSSKVKVLLVLLIFYFGHLSVNAQMCTSVPEPQFPRGVEGKVVINEVEVSRNMSLELFSFDGASAGSCEPLVEDYAWLRSGKGTTTRSITYTFSHPQTSVQVFLLVMGNYYPNQYDLAEISVDGGGNMSLLKSPEDIDCRGIATVSGTRVSAVTEIKGQTTNVSVVVSSTKPFTKLTIIDPRVNTDNLVNDGYGYFVELCPESITPPDSDGDGKLNNEDLDDDNDGVLDTEELSCAMQSINIYPTLGRVSTKANDHNNLIDKDDKTSATLVEDDYIVLDFSKEKSSGTEINIKYSYGGLNLYYYDEVDRVYRMEATLPYSSGETTVSYRLKNASRSFYLSKADNTNQYVYVYSVSCIEKKEVCIDIDTDNDGIIDRLDVDSDNDGCPDAIEAQGDFVNSDLTPSNNLADGTKGSVDEDGIPIVNGKLAIQKPSKGNLINETVIINSLVSNATRNEVCQNGNVNLTVSASGERVIDFKRNPVVKQTLNDSDIIYKWYQSLDKGVTYTLISGQTTKELSLTNVEVSKKYKVEVLTANNGCSSEMEIDLTVKERPSAPVLGVITQPTCEIATGSFQISDYKATNTYNFNPNTGVVISNTGLVSLPQGSYTFTVTDAVSGCTSQVSKPIVINAKPTKQECLLPIASNDNASYTPGKTISVNVIENDIDGDVVVSTTVSLVNGKYNKVKAINDQLVVENEGVWSVTDKGSIVFTPKKGFLGTPTSIQYTVKDAQGSLSNKATVSLELLQREENPAIRLVKKGVFKQKGLDTITNKLKNGVYYTFYITNIGNTVIKDIKLTDAKLEFFNRDVMPSELVVSGLLPGKTFTYHAPKDTKGYPYLVSKELVTLGRVENTATVTGLSNGEEVSDISGTTIDNDATTITLIDPLPVATDDKLDYTIGKSVLIDVLKNDTTGDVVVPSTVNLVNATENKLVVKDEGTWSVDDKGVVTFTPFPDFKKNPTPIEYTVKDAENNTSNKAKITLVAPGSESSIALIKTGVYDVSKDVVFYTFTITNTGKEVLKNIVLTDDKLGLSKVLVGSSDLLPEASIVYEAKYKPTDDEKNTLKKVENTATVIGINPLGIEVTDISGTAIDNDDKTVTEIKVLPIAEDDVQTYVIGKPVTVDVLVNDIKGSKVVSSTIKIVDADKDNKLEVENEGIWSVTSDWKLEFVPFPEFKGLPTPISYNVKDASGNVSNNAVVNLISSKERIIANDDLSEGNLLGTVVAISILENDELVGGSKIIDASLVDVDLNPEVPGVQYTFNIEGEGEWMYSVATEELIFTPDLSFQQNPTPITYELSEKKSGLKDTAEVIIKYEQIPTTPCFVVFNEISPNGDGVNDFLKITCVDKDEYKNNTLEVFNRWGNTVYKAKGYNNNTVKFEGISNGRATIRNKEELPAGTYFYVLDLGDGSSVKKGWIYIQR